MLKPSVLAVIPLTLLLAGGALFAQDEAAEPNGAPETGAARSEPETTAGADSAGDRGRERTDPFDYEASEQISEDLSVSFPVDI